MSTLHAFERYFFDTVAPQLHMMSALMLLICGSLTVLSGVYAVAFHSRKSTAWRMFFSTTLLFSFLWALTPGR